MHGGESFPGSLGREHEHADVDLTCDECGAPLTWSPEADALACEHCGATRAIPRGESTIEERPLAAAGSAARGLGLETRTVECESCGARVALGGTVTSSSCAFCGSASVLDLGEARNPIRPESLIPLDVARAEVEGAFRRWTGGLWFRPNALKRASLATGIGVYVPAWTYDCRVHSDWTADAGYYYWVTERYTVRVNGRSQRRTRRVRKTRWKPARGDRDDSYDDLQVLASRGIDAGLARKLGPFDTTGLVPYRPEFLAGWRAEEYQRDLLQGWDEAHQRVVDYQRRKCAGDVPGDTQRALRVRNDIRDVRWKHVLLPVWSMTYPFKGRMYPVLVHGQTGRVVGDAPYSWVKILALVLLIVALVMAVALANG